MSGSELLQRIVESWEDYLIIRFFWANVFLYFLLLITYGITKDVYTRILLFKHFIFIAFLLLILIIIYPYF